MQKTNSENVVFIYPTLIGIVAFFIVVGYPVVIPTNIAWLQSDDLSTHFLGWHFFRFSDWVIPIGMNPDFGLEISNSIVFSDSNPLFAFVFKFLSPILPYPFQYFGIWILISFILQAWFGWNLLRFLTRDSLIAALGAMLFTFSPPMLQFITTHPSLGSHFLILASLFLVFKPDLRRRRLAWGVLLSTAALVHAYLLAMASLLWIADGLNRITADNLKPRNFALEMLSIGIVLSLLLWQVGYFAIGSSVMAPGYGFYSANVLSLFDAEGWSYILGDIPRVEGQLGVSGFNFLGLGLILLLSAVIPVFFSNGVKFVPLLRRYSFLALALVLFAVFAISNRIGFGAYEIIIPIPEILQTMAETFRASGRMFWPVYYVIVFGILYAVIRGFGKAAVLILSIAVVVQVVDTSAAWAEIRKRTSLEIGTGWKTNLSSPFWGEAAEKYENVRLLLPDNGHPNWRDLAYFAGMNQLATDAVYLARVDRLALKVARERAVGTLRSGDYEPNTLYILDDDVVGRAVTNHIDMLTQIDGLNVLAPGWREGADRESNAD